MTICSSAEVLCAWLQQETFDLLIVNVTVAEEVMSCIPTGQKVVWLTERKGGMTDQEGAMMLKYDSAPRLLRRWMEYAGKTGKLRGEAEPSPPIFAVWSAAGGVGKTKLVSLLAKAWLDEGLRLFVIGLDPAIYDNVSLYAVQFHDASEWLYELKSGRELGDIDSTAGVSALWHVFLPECSVREFLSISREETAALLHRAASRYGCDAVLVDAGTGWSPFIDEVWGRAETIVCVSTEERESMCKTDKWFQEWEAWSEHGALRSKTLFVINKCLPRGETVSFDWMQQGFRLPYVPEWKQDSSRVDAVFQQRVQELAKGLWDRCSSGSRWNL